MIQSEHRVTSLFGELRGGSRRALARCLSLIESTASDDRLKAYELLALCGPLSGASRRIGLTGAPGVGKSTLVEALGLGMLEHGRRVAVLAVDPSSKRTGGSILGDKVRMPQLSLADRAYVRPSPSKLALGGATITTRDAIIVCEAAGYDTILVETVGVGQSETEVADMVDLFLLLLLPTAGDEVQGIKRGIMEVAHALVITKSDIDHQASSRAEAMFTSTLRMMTPPNEDWIPPVMSMSSEDGNGIVELIRLCDSFFRAERKQTIQTVRGQQRSTWFTSALQYELGQIFERDRGYSTLIEAMRAQVLSGTVPPSVALHRLFSTLSIAISERM